MTPPPRRSVDSCRKPRRPIPVRASATLRRRHLTPYVRRRRAMSEGATSQGRARGAAWASGNVNLTDTERLSPARDYHLQLGEQPDRAEQPTTDGARGVSGPLPRPVSQRLLGSNFLLVTRARAWPGCSALPERLRLERVVLGLRDRTRVKQVLCRFDLTGWAAAP
jgi:hypothetical protein